MMCAANIQRQLTYKTCSLGIASLQPIFLYSIHNMPMLQVYIDIFTGGLGCHICIPARKNRLLGFTWYLPPVHYG